MKILLLLRIYFSKNWAPDSGFESYLLRKKAGGLVVGRLVDITQAQRDIITNWELVDAGWYKLMTVGTWSPQGVYRRASTEGLRSGQPFDRIANGINYKRYLMDKSAMHESAEKVRLKYLEALAHDLIEPSSGAN